MKTIKLKKGLDIAIDGAAELRMATVAQPKVLKIVPDDYRGLVAKLAVREGDAVKIGSAILFDKNHPELKIVSPVSGKVVEVARGERRKLLYVAIERDAAAEQAALPAIDLNADRAAVHAAVLEAGFGALILQRPYDVVANPALTPKAVFVSAFDSAPLAPDYNFVLKGRAADVQAGLNVLAKLANKVYYSVSPATSSELRNMKGVELTEFCGAHPAGNVGVQMNHLDPINKGEVAWSMNVQDVAVLGHFALTGKLDLSRIVAYTGPDALEPAYVKITPGTPVAVLTNCNISRGVDVRIVNGNVLSGAKADADSVVSPFAAQITALTEGDNADELFGWIMPRLNKFSNNNLYTAKIFAKLFPKMKFDFDARLLGGRRAFIVSGEMEKVLPMDIMPEQLVKAMLVKNLDKMEQLGAYEIAPEDLALCEYVCTSKIEIQRIVREALDYMRRELE